MKTVFDISSGKVISQASAETVPAQCDEQEQTRLELRQLMLQPQVITTHHIMPPELMDISVDTFITGQK